MKPEPRRKVTLLDMMVLVAATAAGIALLQSCIPDSRANPNLIGWVRYVRIIFHGVNWTWVFLSPWGPALLLIRVLPPRPPIGRALRQPGAVACAAASLALAVRATFFAIPAATLGVERAHREVYLESPYLVNLEDGQMVAFAVAGAWLALILAGLWRPAGDWVDRLGRLVGLTWVGGYMTMRVAWLSLALVAWWNG